MLALLALASALVADTPPLPSSAPAASRREYEAARAAAGRSPEDQVRLAYWCEAHGLAAERLRHLAQAVLADPGNVTARGLLGLVARDGRWARPDDLAARQGADPAAVALLAEYDARRAATPYKADDQLDLGVWADDRGLEEQAKAHFTAAVRLDPGRDAAWRRLGYVKHDGRWATDAQLAADRADANAQKAADRKWKPLLAKWRGMLVPPAQRDEAEANLLGVTDPRAVPSILKVFGPHEADHPRLVRLLGQVDSPAASRALASVAAFTGKEEVRRAATETLRGRDAREYADLLIGLLREGIRYEVTPVGGPGLPGVLRVEGKQANVNRVYAPPAPTLRPGERIDYDPRFGPVIVQEMGWWASSFEKVPETMQRFESYEKDQNGYLQELFPALRNGGFSPKDAAAIQNVMVNASPTLPLNLAAAQVRESLRILPPNPTTAFSFVVRNQNEYLLSQRIGEAQKTAAAAQEQLASDARAIDRVNAQVDQDNGRVVGILKATTGLDLPESPEPWARWWVNLVGYRYSASNAANSPTIIEQVPLGYQPQYQPIDFVMSFVGMQRISCFGAGTIVETDRGPRAIETLHVGDVVLTQSTSTGALGYQPILVTHHNPPSGTFRIRLAGGTIVSSAFHRFWVARRGWVMARDLKAGDPVRTLGGVIPIEAVEMGGTEPVFNLDVAEDADFFAGAAAALVHDNTLPDPRLAPFDRPETRKEVAAR